MVNDQTKKDDIHFVDPIDRSAYEQILSLRQEIKDLKKKLEWEEGNSQYWEDECSRYRMESYRLSDELRERE